MLGKLIASLKNTWLPASFCVREIDYVRKGPRASGPLIHEPTPLFDLFLHTDHNGGLRLCIFDSKNCLSLHVDSDVQAHRAARNPQSPIVE